MKKIILIIFFSFIFINKIYASTEFSQYKDNDNNLELELKYKWYKEFIEGEYLPIDIENNNFKYIDNTNIKYGEYSTWNDDCNNNDNSLNKEMKLIYRYREIVSAKYIVIQSFSTTFKINNLNIYNNNQKIDYKMLKCDNCDIENNTIFSNSILIIDLNSYYKPWNLSFNIDLESTNNSSINQYKLYLYKDIDNKVNSGAGNKTIYDSNTTKNFKYDSSWTNKITYTDTLFSEEPISNNYYNLLSGSKVMCRYRKIYNYRYNIIKKYYDNNYHNNILGYKKDYEDFLIYYKLNNINNSINNNKDTIGLKVIEIKDKKNNCINREKFKSETKIKYIKKSNTNIYIITFSSLIINFMFSIYLIIKFCRLKHL